jgi:hypothetical protein
VAVGFRMMLAVAVRVAVGAGVCVRDGSGVGEAVCVRVWVAVGELVVVSTGVIVFEGIGRAVVVGSRVAVVGCGAAAAW